MWDGVVFSWLDIFKCEYIGEVIEICGIILIVDIVWFISLDDFLRENIFKGRWYFYKFFSFVGYRCILVVLKVF